MSESTYAEFLAELTDHELRRVYADVTTGRDAMNRRPEVEAAMRDRGLIDAE